MDDDPPPEDSATSAISGRESSSTSRAIRPQAPVVAVRASAMRVIGRRSVCHAGTSSRPSREARRSSPAVPTGPPHCAGKASAARSSEAADRPERHAESLWPKVIGSAHCVSVRPIIGASPREAASWSSADEAEERCERTSPTPSRSISTIAVSSTSCDVRPVRTSTPGLASRRAATSGMTALPPASASKGPSGTVREVSAHADSTATIAATIASSVNTSPARRSPGQSSSLIAEVEEDGLVLALEAYVEAEAGLVGDGHEGRPTVRLQPVEERVGRARQVRAREEPVEQAACEDGDRDERRRLPRHHRGEAVAPLRVGRAPTEAGEGPAVAVERSRLLHDLTGLAGLPELEDGVG